MDYTKYKTTWHLVLIHEFCGCFIVGVYGKALLDDATEKAKAVNGEVRSLSSYGMAYHCGQRFE